MPNTRTAPRKAARRIAQAPRRDAGKQLAPTNGAGKSGEQPPAEEAYSRYVKLPELMYSMDEIEQFCTGCDRILSPMAEYRVVRRGGQKYCPECAKQSLPTAAEMVAVVARAFDIIAAIARRGDEGSLDAKVALYAQDELRPELAGFDWDHWEALVRIREHLAYRPVATA
jgi:hypothetical protein